VALARAGAGSETNAWSVALDSTITAAGSKSCTLYVRMSETVALNTWIRPTFEADSIGTYFARDTVTASGNRTCTFAKPPVTLAMTTLGETGQSPFRAQTPGDSRLVLSGRIGAGATADSLTKFGVWFDTTNVGADLNGDSIAAVLLRIDSPSVQTVTLAQNGTPWLYMLSAPVTIESGTPFSVHLRVFDTAVARSLIGETIIARIPADSVTTSFAGSAAGDTSSSCTITFVYTDTVTLIDGSPSDANLHPDSRIGENPFVAWAGAIRGQTSMAGLSDTLTRFGVRFVGTATHGANDSVAAAWLSFNGDGTETVALARAGAGSETNAWSVALDSTITAAGSKSCTLYVRMSETVALNTWIRPTFEADSIGTYFARDTVTASGNRTCTFAKPSVAAGMLAIAANGQSPFRAQTAGDSRLVMAGVLTTATSDTLTRFGVRIDTSTGILADSILTVRLYLGATQRETTLVADGSFLYRLSADTSIANNDTFRVTVTMADGFARSMIGETIHAWIPTDSVMTAFTSGAVTETSSGCTITFVYTDTALIVDSSPANATFHPDSRLGQNPFVAWAGAIRGQTSTAGLSDTLTRFGVRFTGTATHGPAGATDSVAAAWLAFNATDTVALARNGAETNAWTVTLDSTITAAGSKSCTLYVRMSETVALSTTFRVTFDADSIATFFTRDTGGVQGSRVVTFDRSRVTLAMENLGNISTHADSRIAGGAIGVVVCSGVIVRDSVIGNFPDTLSSFGVGFVYSGGMTSNDVESIALVVNGQQYTMQRTTGTDSWASTLGDSGQSITDTAFFQVWLRARAATPLDATATAWIPADSVVTFWRTAGPAAADSSQRIVTFSKAALRLTMGVRSLDQVATIRTSIDTKAIAAFTVASDYSNDSLTTLTVTLSADSSRVAIQSIYLVRDANGDSIFTYGADTLIWPMTATSSLAGESRYVFNRVAENTAIDTKVYMIVARFSAMDDDTFRIRIAAGQCTGLYTAAGPASLQSYDTFLLITPDTIPPASPATLTVASLNSQFILTFPQSTDTTSWKNGILKGQYNIYVGAKGGGMPDTLLGRIYHDSTQPTRIWTVTVTSDSIQTATGIVPADGDSHAFRVTAVDFAGNEGVAQMIVTGLFRVSATAAPFSATIVAPTAGQIVYKSPAVLFSAEATGVEKSSVTAVLFQVTDSRGVVLISDTSTTYIDATDNRIFTSDMNLDVAGFDSGQVYLIRAIARTATGSDTYAAYSSFSITTSVAQANYVADTSAGVIATCTQTLYGATDVTAFSAGDNVARVEEFPVSSARNIILTTPLTGASVSIEIPADALTGLAGWVRCTVVLGRSGANGSGMSDTARRAIQRAGVIVSPYWFEFLPNGDTTLRGGLRATITMNVIDANNDGICDSTGINLRTAVMYTLNAAGELEALQLVSRGAGFLRFSTSHFSPFFFAPDTGTTTVGLARLIVGPNPYRPNDGNEQTGKVYVAGDNTTGVIFRNLPPNVKIEIYTILGEKVIDISKNSATSGQVNWSGKNAEGRDVASGYYLYVVTDQSTGQRVTGKVAVIR
jgi:hypothetical protein